MARDTATSYRLGPETLDQIARLREAVRDHLGRALSASDVIRLAVSRLAESELTPPKNSRKKPASGIDRVSPIG